MTKSQGQLNPETIRKCKQNLVTMKAELLNRAKSSAFEYARHQADRSTTGDEIDQSVALLEEQSFLLSQERMRQQILDIELALSRIENGTFGVCEETEELIEVERLVAIPWTRLSIEGAEIREALSQRFAR